MEKIFKDAEDIIKWKYNEDDPNYGLLVLGCFALLSKFGEEYFPIVEKVMMETEIHISDKSLKVMLQDTDIDIEYGFDEEELNEDDMVVTAVSMPGYQLDLSDTGSILYRKRIPAIYCSTKEENNNTILNAFVHEASHLVKSTINNISQNKNNSFLLRNGLNIFGYCISEGQLCSRNDNSMLDEVINVLQTADLMRNVQKLKGMKLSSKVKIFYDDLDLDELDNMYGYGYTELSEFVRPLWSVEDFKNSVEGNVVIGRLDRIQNEFDEVLGKGSFHLYSTYLDYIDGNYTDDKLMKQMSDWYGRMNRLYVIKSAARHKK